METYDSWKNPTDRLQTAVAWQPNRKRKHVNSLLGFTCLKVRLIIFRFSILIFLEAGDKSGFVPMLLKQLNFTEARDFSLDN